MPREITEQDIKRLIEERRWSELRESLSGLPAPELADRLEALDPKDRMLVFRSLPRTQASEVFAYLETPQQNELVRNLTNEDARQILADLTPDDRTALLEELPAEVTQRLLSLLSPEDLKEARTLLGYPEESVGRLMTPDYVAIRANWTIQQALDHIRKQGRDAETVNMIYVLDDKGRLIDDLRLRQILLADPQATVESIMDRKFAALRATDDREEAVRLMKEYDRVALPVVDSDGVLLGIVTSDDVLDVAEEEATEDIQKMGGMEALDEPYLETPFFQMVRKRGSWLSFLFLGEMLTATAMGYFEQEIARAVVLALFIPLIISSGGNSGSQAASLVIRAMALQEILLRDWWRVMRREVAAGLVLGGILGGIAMIRILMWPNRLSLYGPHYVRVALTVSLSLVGVVLWGTLTGSMLPFIFRRLGFDPAVSSSPFVATLVDVT
ncbi:MAG TPA: magnesium transporter [Candidatus Binatia bacterium]|nr:magnesium transporter [Candidatus Binatia bacterium]